MRFIAFPSSKTRILDDPVTKSRAPVTLSLFSLAENNRALRENLFLSLCSGENTLIS